jgi:7-cyano-7-deazaguanine synthase in queuosine biosynthesis
MPVDDGVAIEWGPLGVLTELNCSLDPWATSAGPVAPQVLDLFRIMAAAYVADRLTKRRALPRELALTVHVTRPDLFAQPALDTSARVLRFLTGDNWSVVAVQDTSIAPQVPELELLPTRRVALLSGGLDSFAHAAVLCRRGECSDTLFLSHAPNPMSIRAQNACADHLTSVDAAARFQSVALRHQTTKRESTNHSRAMLFVALALLYADATGASEVVVPENGFTSLNVPLSPNRQGRYSTRSTHPYTFFLIRELLDQLRLPIVVRNPCEWETKGDMVREAYESAGSLFAAAAAQTLSCGKLDGYHYAGGNSNLGCGLCYACLVRRASFIAAGMNDGTTYLFNTLVGTSLESLLANRESDVRAVGHAIRMGVDADMLAASSPFPPGFDLDCALDLWKRGLDELAGLDLRVD